MALDQIDIDPPKAKQIKQPKEEKEMSFFDHIEELRWHIFRSAGSILVFGVTVFFMKDFVFNTIIFGPTKPEFITYRLLCDLSHSMGMGESLCIALAPFKFSAINVGEQFLTHMRVSAVLGLVASFPYIFWEIWRFVKPGLYENEQKLTRYVVLICSSLFFLGVAFGYYVIAPFAVSFLVGYEIPGVQAMPSLSSYIGYLIMFTLPVGIVFEMPVVAYVMGNIGILSSQFLKDYRRHAIAIIVILAGIITPPDAFSQILIAVPLLVLYEVSIGVVKRIEKKKALED